MEWLRMPPLPFPSLECGRCPTYKVLSFLATPPVQSLEDVFALKGEQKLAILSRIVIHCNVHLDKHSRIRMNVRMLTDKLSHTQ